MTTTEQIQMAETMPRDDLRVVVHAMHPVTDRVRKTLAGIGVFMLLTGVIEIAIGCSIKYSRRYPSADKEDEPSPETPPITLPLLWIAGLAPILTGISGILCTYQKDRKWICGWIITSLVINIVGFVVCTELGVFDPAQVGVNLHIYSDCAQEITGDSSMCACRWYDGDIIGIFNSACETAKYNTSLYIPFVVIHVIYMGVLCIAWSLSAVYVCCIQKCVPEASQLNNFTSSYGTAHRRLTESTILPSGQISTWKTSVESDSD